MKPNTPINPSPPSRKTRLLRVLIVLATIVAIGFVIFLVNDLTVRSHYTNTVSEFEKIKKDILQPMGAVQITEEKRGDGLMDKMNNCGIDVQCPTAGGVWFVPIEPGKEAEFLRTMIREQGYSDHFNEPTYACTQVERKGYCGASGSKGSFDIGAHIDDAENIYATPPSNDVSPKIWQKLDFSITYSPKTSH